MWYDGIVKGDYLPINRKLLIKMFNKVIVC